MNTQICVQCQTRFMPKENGVYVFELYQDGNGVSKIWKADLFGCQCKDQKEIVSDFSKIPYAVQHFDEGFDMIVQAIRESGRRIYEWKEKE